MKDPVKLLIGILAIVALGLVLFFFLTNDPEETSDPLATDSTSVVSEESPDSGPQTPQPGSIEDHNTLDLGKQENAPSFREDDIAVPVDGNPLLVTLLNYPELGQISIERYSQKEGGFTGKPLKSGTKVQIPDPNRKGERIQFTVP